MLKERIRIKLIAGLLCRLGTLTRYRMDITALLLPAGNEVVSISCNFGFSLGGLISKRCPYMAGETGFCQST